MYHFPMPARLLIDSALRNTGGNSTASDFVINTYFETPILIAKFVDAFIPFSWLPIDVTNNTLIFNEGGPNIQAIIATPATWSASDIGAAIQTALNANGGQTYTVVFNVATNAYTISAAANFSLRFGDMIAQNQFNTLNRILGFANINTIAAMSVTGGFMAMPWGPEYVYITSNKILEQTRDSDTYSKLMVRQGSTTLTNGDSILMTIPVQSGPGTTIFFSKNDDARIVRWAGSGYKPQYIDFKLLNPWTLQPLLIRNNWKLQLEIATVPEGLGEKQIGIS